MKFASYEQDGAAAYGLVSGRRLTTITGDLAARYPDLKAALAGGALREIGAALRGVAPDVGLDEVALLPPVTDPDKILCIGLNYKAHVEETGRGDSEQPTIFVRFPASQVGHERPIVRPAASTRLDYEGELAVIIGRAGRHINEAAALDHIAGYACFNDGSVRDWQRHTSQFTPGKNFVASGSFGPWLVTADEIPDPTRLTLTTRLNGAVMQHATTDLLLFPIPELIAYISTFAELLPGDVIATGTPGGVGSRRDPPVWVEAGDSIEVEIDAIGVLRNPVIAET